MHQQAVALEAIVAAGIATAATTVAAAIAILVEMEGITLAAEEEDVDAVVEAAEAAVETTTTITTEVVAGEDVAEIAMTTTIKILGEEVKIITDLIINES